jgi:hypothetical protein
MAAVSPSNFTTAQAGSTRGTAVYQFSTMQPSASQKITTHWTYCDGMNPAALAYNSMGGPAAMQGMPKIKTWFLTRREYLTEI